jgi:N-methylhydantoinase A
VKEYERASTALADSYLKPVVSRQMGSMRNRLDAAGFKAPTVVMNSNGGEMTLSAAADAQVNLVVSARPAGSSGAATWLGSPAVIQRGVRTPIGPLTP